MQELFQSLGINWKLLLSQGVNFLILLAVLTALLWRPLLKAMEERKKKIEFGVKLGEEAEKKLNEIDDLKKEKLIEADLHSQRLIREAEKEAGARSNKMVEDAKVKGDSLLREATEAAELSKKESFLELEKESKEILRSALKKIVNLNPKEIEAKLFEQALSEFQKKNEI